MDFRKRQRLTKRQRDKNDVSRNDKINDVIEIEKYENDSKTGN